MHGPLYYAVARLMTRAALRKQGKSFWEINQLMEGADDDVIDAAAVASKTEVGAIGDGTILQAIIDFLKSPAGQQLIAALIQMLLLALSGA